MLMFSLHNLDIRLTLVIPNTSLKQHLEGRFVCLFLLNNALVILNIYNYCEVIYKMPFFLWASAVVVYSPKSKADKKKSLLGGVPDSSESQVTPEVCYLLT